MVTINDQIDLYRNDMSLDEARKSVRQLQEIIARLEEMKND